MVMLIKNKQYEQVIITKNQPGNITDNKGNEVIAVISDDNELIVKDGYNVELVPILQT